MNIRNKKFPIFCPLSFTADLNKLSSELNLLKDKWLKILPNSMWIRKPIIPYSYQIADKEHYDNCENTDRVDGKPVNWDGKYKTWLGMSLTHIPINPATKYGSVRFRTMKDWIWDDSLDIPYTKEVISRLPYKELNVVRLMVIEPGGFGPLHKDDFDDDLWEKNDIVSTTITISHGGSPLKFVHNDKMIDVKDDVFFFKDSVYHGVPPVKSQRMILRINGKVDYQKYNELMQFDKSIW